MVKAFAYKNTMETIMNSSSGGAFWGIAEAFYRSGGGYCYGAKFNSDFNVVHASVTSLPDCSVFQGSKYVWSDISGCFNEIENQLSEGHRVLFTGTPCQIAALKQFVRTKHVNENLLYTVDIVCHGSPNPVVWRDYVRHLEERYNSKLIEFSFRYKPHGWKGYPIYAKFENGKVFINKIGISSYQNMFRKNILMRESCFRCPYPGCFQSDLTICDFWGVELCMPEIDTQGGVSLIQVHTDKGNEILKVMENKSGVLLKEVPDGKYLDYNNNLTSSTQRPDLYDAFWADYKSKDIEYVLNKYGDENLVGKIKFYGKDVLRRSGLADLIKKVMGRA